MQDEADRQNTSRLGLRAELEAQSSARPFTTATAADYEHQVLAKLAEWRDVLRQAPQEARSILRELV